VATPPQARADLIIKRLGLGKHVTVGGGGGYLEDHERRSVYLSIGARQADTDGEHYSVRHGGRQPTIQHSRSADLQWGPAVKNDEMTEAAMNAVNGTKRSTITACYTVRIQLEQTRPDARKCRQQQRVYSLHWIE